MTALGREITGELSRAALSALPPGATFRLAVAGLSMMPVLQDGDAVVAQRTAGPSDWALGDILVAELPEVGLVVHRLLWAGGGTVRTRGDGSGQMDRPIPNDRVLGRVIGVERGGRAVGEGPLRRRLAWLRGFSAAGLAWLAARARRGRGGVTGDGIKTDGPRGGRRTR